MKVIIAGGVAAGASTAARLRRLDENCEILLLEKGGNISYANCGLPYHLGGVIPERDNLLVMEPERFSAWLNVEVRTHAEVTAIDRAQKCVTVKTPQGVSQEHYDKLLLAIGATPQGAGENSGSRLLHCWTLADMDRISARLKEAKKAVIIGAGFIGLEVAENLRKRGLSVTLLQRGSHVLPTLDAEMAGALADELTQNGIELLCGTTVESMAETPEAVTLKLSGEKERTADLVIESIGVRPNSALAQAAGLSCGPQGHIQVNEFLQTSDPDIFAAGDVVEVQDPIFGGKTSIMLAGPANKQGRIAAANLTGKRIPYRGTFGANVVKVGRLCAASVGYSETKLKAMGKEFHKIYLHPASHASYYPGTTRLTMKLLFGKDGTIYGAQIVGKEGVDKRIDTIAQAMRSGRKAPELGELELAYAPPYSSAKDPVNFAGFIAENVLSGLSDTVTPDMIPAGALILDVREPEEHDLGAIPGAINIPLGELRKRLKELDPARQIVCCCQVGLRGYLAERILKQNGFTAANLSGGYLTYRQYHPESKKGISPMNASNVPFAPQPDTVLDVRTLPCPGPVIQLKKVFSSVPAGTAITVLAADSFEPGLRRWSTETNCTIQSLRREGSDLQAVIVKGAAETPSPCLAISEHSVAIVLFSNDLDKALAALILANGLAASGAKVGIFFTFWGLSVLRKNPAPAVRKNWVSRMFGWMLPCGAEKLALSKMHMLGMGSAMMKQVMKQQNVLTLPELLQSAREAGVRFIACDMAMGVMGITREELIEVDEVAGVAAFAELARNCNNTLFI